MKNKREKASLSVWTVLVILKLLGVVTFSWWYLNSPILLVLVIASYVVVYNEGKKKGKSKEK